jgi:NADH:ubiquinone oxidoreductase subunit E
MQRTYRATLGPRPLDLAAVEPDPKRQAKLARLVERHVHAPTALHGRAPGAVDLMGLLRAAHDLYGCLSRPLVEYLARVCELYTGQVYATASFYSDIYLDPKGRHLLKVCTGTTCHVKGADRLVRAVTGAAGTPVGETDASGTFTVFTTSCVGACSLAPVLMVDTDIYGKPEPEGLATLLAPYRSRA